MIFVSCGCLHALCCSVLSNKVLNTIRDPNVEETNTTDSAKPGKRITYIATSIVSVKAKETTDEDAPSYCFESVLEPENVLNFESVVFKFSFLFVVTIFKKIVVWRGIILNILSPKLMDFSNLINVLFCPLIKIIKILTISSHTKIR